MYGSIIIPTYNKCTRLELTLLTLEKQDYDPAGFEVIVVDDGSTDDTNRVVQWFLANTCLNFKYIRQENKGRAAARNTGVKAAKGEIILFLDDDRLVYPDYVSEHMRVFTEREQGEDTRLVVLGKRFNLYISRFEEDFAAIRQTVMRNPETIFRRGRVEYYWRKVKNVFNMPAISWLIFTTGNVSMGAQILKEINLFNEKFQGWGLEDTELGYRLWKQGAQFINNEKALNFHMEHSRNQTEREEDIVRNHDLFYQLHPEEPVEFFRMFIDGEISLEGFNNKVEKRESTDETGEVFYYSDGKRWIKKE